MKRPVSKDSLNTLNESRAREAYKSLTEFINPNLSEDEWVNKLKSDENFAISAYDKTKQAAKLDLLDATSAQDFADMLYAHPVEDTPKQEQSVSQEQSVNQEQAPQRKMFSSVASTIQNPLEEYKRPEDIAGPNYTFPIDIPEFKNQPIEERKEKELPQMFKDTTPTQQLFGKDTIIGEGYYDNPIHQLGQGSAEEDIHIIDQALADIEKKIQNADAKYSGMLDDMTKEYSKNALWGIGKNAAITNAYIAESDPRFNYIVKKKTELSLQKDLLETLRQVRGYDASQEVEKELQQMVDEGLISQGFMDHLRSFNNTDKEHQRMAIDKAAQWGGITPQTQEKLNGLLDRFGDLSDHNTVGQGLVKTGKLKDFVSLGITEIARNFDIKDIADRVNKGETVSTEERNVLAIYSKLSNFNSEEYERGFWWEGGRGMQQSLQFVLSAMATGGVGTIGKTAATSTAKYIAKNIARQAVLTPLTPMMTAEYSRLELNDAMQGKKNSGKNLWKAYASTFGERFSETLGVMVGDWWGAKDVFGKLLTRGSKVKGVMGEAFKTMGDLSDKISNNDWWKATGDALSYGGITSWPGEIASESSGNVITSMLTLDAKPLKEFTNLRFYGQIALQTSFMSGANVIMKSIAGGVYNAVDAYQTNKNYKKAMETLHNAAPLKDQKLEDLRQQLIYALENNQYLDENGEIANAPVTDIVGQINKHIKEDGIYIEDLETYKIFGEAASLGMHKFGKDSAVEAYVESQIGEYANKDGYVYELDYNGNSYFILDSQGKATTIIDRVTGEKKVISQQELEGSNHKVKRTRTEDWAKAMFLTNIDLWNKGESAPVPTPETTPVEQAQADAEQQPQQTEVDNTEEQTEGQNTDGVRDNDINPKDEAIPQFDAVSIGGKKYDIINLDLESNQCTIIDEEGNERIIDLDDEGVTPFVKQATIDAQQTEQTQLTEQEQQDEQQTQQQDEQGEKNDLPLDKDGDIDFDTLLDISPERYAQEYVNAVGNAEEAVSDMNDEIKRIDGEINGLIKKRKGAALKNKPKISKQIATLTKKKQSIESVISLLSQQTNTQPVEQAQTEGGVTPFTAGQNITDKWNAAEKVYGNEDTQIAPNGEVIHGRWVVTEADAATPSHDPFTYQSSKGYPVTPDGKNVNDNDYTNKVADVTGKSASYDGRAFENTPKVLGGVVIDGNNRTMSRIQAAQQGTDSKYLETLRTKSASRGISAESYTHMKNPTMYFEVTDQLPLTTETFAMFNARESKAKSPVDMAIAVGKRDTKSLISSILKTVGSLEKITDLYKNQGLVAQVMRLITQSGVINQNDMPALYTEKYGITDAGKDFIESVLVGSLLKEEQVRLLNSEGLKQYREKIVSCILPIIENGRYEDNIVGRLNTAILYLKEARDAKTNLRGILFDIPMYEKKDYDSVTIFTALMLQRNTADFRQFINHMNTRLKDSSMDSMYPGMEQTAKSVLEDYKTGIEIDEFDENGKKRKIELTDYERETIRLAEQAESESSQGGIQSSVQGDGTQVDTTGERVDGDGISTGESQSAEQVTEESEGVEIEQEEPIQEQEVETTQEEPIQEQKSAPIEITPELIDSLDIDDEIKDYAKDYLNGQVNSITENAFKTIQDYVQNELPNGTANSTDADTAQLGGTTDDASVRTMGRDGEQNRPMDRGQSDGDVSTERPSGEDSEGGLFSVPGETGDSTMEQPTSDGSSDSSNRRTRSSRSRGERSDVRKSARPTDSSTSSANDGQGAVDTRTEIDETLESLDKELEEALSQARQLLKDSANTVGALGNAEMFKLLGVVGKIGYIYTKKGFYTFKKWYSQMYISLSPMMQNHFTTEEIDQFIKDMWDTKVTRNGERRKISEWAAIVEQEELRKMVRMDLEEKIALQKSREKVETIVGDLDNIRESLPFLLPQQQEDVLKAETQFFSQSHKARKYGNGKGIMFTNGTGTGKTYTGLGIVKRFLKQGKGRILIITAQDKKIKDWIRDASNLGIEATQLKDTKDKGKGVVVTQFANMYQNRALLEDEWDLIVYDESHKIQESKDGRMTARAVMHHMLSNRDLEQAVRRELRDHELFKKEYELRDELELLKPLTTKKLNDFNETEKQNWERYGGNSESIENRIAAIDKDLDALKKLQDELVKQTLRDENALKKAQNAVDKTKVVFLSATPFNTAMNLDYAESYIFSYNPDAETQFDGKYLPSELRDKDRDNFVLDKFPSSHAKQSNGRVIKKEEHNILNPEESSQEEIDFSESLQEMGTLSGRVLDSEWDYSRQFPKLNFPQAAMFNVMYNALKNGEYRPLLEAGYFKVFTEYRLYTEYFEAIKTALSVDRIKEHTKLGRKVVVFHRRKSNKEGGVIGSPINDAIAEANIQSEEHEMLMAKFQREFADYLIWERSANLDFAHYKITEAFATEEERAEYKEELAKWAEKNKERIANGKKPTERPVIKTKSVVIFSGMPTEKQKRENAEAFNNDNSDVKVVVVQVQSGKEGVDFHDKTGKFPRAEVNLYLPESPIEFIQAEGRIYRIGNKSNAIFEYPLLGIDLELASFAMKINGRAQTSENLALGEKSRGLRDSISRAALSSRPINVDSTQGVGGKQLDSKSEQKKEGFDEAITNYNEWKDKQSDIYEEKQVPDPIGERMVSWAMGEGGETVLIPYAGEGSIARYADPKTRLVAYESRMDRFARLAMLCGGSGRKIENEEYNGQRGISNDNILFFSPKQKVDDEVKDILFTLDRLTDSGRMVVLTSAGDMLREQMSKIFRLDKSVITRAEIKLPPSIMGINKNKLEVIVIDKISNKDLQQQANTDVLQQDISNITDEAQLWEALRGIQIPKRLIDNVAKTRKRAEKALAKFIESSPLVKKRTDYLNSGKSKQVPYVTKYTDACSFTFKGNKQFYFYYPYYTKGETRYSYREVERLAQDWLNKQQFIEKYGENTEKWYATRVEIDKAVCNFIEALLDKTPPQLKNIALGMSENVVTGKLDIQTLRDTIKGMFGNNATMERLNDRVMKVAEGFGIEVEIVSEANPKFRDKKSSVQGFYSTSDNKIWIKEEFINSSRVSNDKKAEVLLHEAIHGVTVYALREYELGRIPESSPLYQACREINDVYEQIKNDATVLNAIKGKNGWDAANNEYGLSDVYEMVAELANPLFRAALKAKKLWKQLINGIKMILGIQIQGVESSETNALNVLEEALDTLLDNADVEMYNRSVSNMGMFGREFYKVVTDAEQIARLESSPKKIGYRNVVLNYDGTLGSPMASGLRTKGKDKVKTNSFEIGKWEQAEENPQLADEKGKITLVKPDGKTVSDVDYNPYIHNRLDMVNAQFKQAWERPNLVYIETEVSVDDLESGYKADKAAKPVGVHKWSNGDLMLTRYDKPIRIVPWSEVANDWVERFKDRGVEFDIVPPALLPILTMRGVEILPPHKGMSQNCIDAYNEWKKNPLKKKEGIITDEQIEQLNKKYGLESNTQQPKIRFRSDKPFYSNAEIAVKGIKQEKATPEQWIAMLTKNGGLKASEDRWLGLSDWLKEQKGTVTKQQILDYINQNKIEVEDVNYAENAIAGRQHQQMEDILQEKFDRYLEKEGNKKLAFKALQEELGGELMDEIEMVGTHIYLTFPFEDNTRMRVMGSALGVDITLDNPIDNTRLIYTTEGLNNKREIALTVPTIEPWNKYDNIHFGDAGDGRAVVWIRFGETTEYDNIEDIQQVSQFHEPYKNANGMLVYNPIGSFSGKDFIVYGKARNGSMIYVVFINEQQIPVAHNTLEDARLAMNEYYKQHPRTLRVPKKVLVIDEIQSKRHQDARELGGYRPTNIDKFLKDNNVEVVETGEFYEFIKDGKLDKSFSKGILHYDIEKAKNLYVSGYAKSNIPDAPFEKNWHELAMKRMLRYAAENGYDKIAWTKGEQQAERYDLGLIIDHISYLKREDGTIDARAYLPDGTFQPIGKTLDEISSNVGREIAAKIQNNESNRTDSLIYGYDKNAKRLYKDYNVIESSDLKIGGEGMKGFYDKMLVDFMNKYGKKWGVKVQDVELSNIGQTMHSVDVTDAMVNSVMNGQPMFRDDSNVSERFITAQAKGISEAAAQTKISELSQTLNTEVNYVTNEDITGNTPTDRKKRRSKGWFEDGKVYINLSNNETVEDAVETFLHETVAHKGLRGLLGDKFESTMKKVFDSLTPSQQEALMEIFNDEIEAAEEFLASMAENNTEPTLLERVLSIIRDALRHLNILDSFTNGDLQYLLWKAKNNLKEGATFAQEVRFKEKDAQIRYRTNQNPAGIVPEDIKMNWWDHTTEYLQDKARPVRKIMDEIERLGGYITEDSDPHNQEVLSMARAAEEIEKFGKEQFSPMMDKVTEVVGIIIDKKGVTYQEAYDMVTDYLYAKHAPERNKFICVKEMIDSALSTLSVEQRALLNSKVKANINRVAGEIYDNYFTGGKNLIKGDGLTSKEEAVLMSVAMELQNQAENILNSDRGNNRSGMTDAEAQSVINDIYDNDTQNAFDELEKLVKDCTDFTLDKWLEYGFISSTQYATYKGMFTNYIPLRGWEEREDIPYSDIAGRTYNMASEILDSNKMAKGRTSKAFNPLSHIASLAITACVSGNRNKVRQSAFNLIENNLGLVEHLAYLDTTYEIYDKKGKDGKIVQITNRRPDESLIRAGLVKIRKNDGYLSHKTYAERNVHTVDAYFNGKKNSVVFRGEIGARAATAINGIGNDSRFILLQWISKINRFISANLTARSYKFLVGNLIKDLGFGNFAYYVENGGDDLGKLNKYYWESYSIIFNDLTGRKNSEQHDKLYQEFKENGGKTGYVQLESIYNIDKEIKNIVAKASGQQGVVSKIKDKSKFILDAFDVLGTTTENAMRFAVYRTSREKGLSPRESALRAKEITVNFNRRGKDKFFNSIYSFFNASIQGTYRFGKLASSNPVRFTIAMGLVIGLKFGFSMMAKAFSGGDDEEENPYNRLSDYVKANNIVIPIPDIPGTNEESKFICIPLAPSIRSLSYFSDCLVDIIYGNKTAGEAMGDYLLMNAGEFIPFDIDAIDLTSDSPGATFMTAATPTFLRPAAEINNNRNFMGLPIYKEPYVNDKYDPTPQFKMVYDRTNDILVGTSRFLNEMAGGNDMVRAGIKKSQNGIDKDYWIGNLLDVNPAKVEHILKGYFGGVADIYLDAISTGKETYDAVVKGEDLDVKKVMLMTQFLKYPSQKPGYDTYYDLVDEAKQIITLEREARKQNNDEDKDYFRSKTIRDIVKLYKKYSEGVDGLRDKKLRLERNGKGNSEEHKNIQEKMDSLILEAARKYNEIKEQRDKEN